MKCEKINNNWLIVLFTYLNKLFFDMIDRVNKIR
jgi:hypothetical protein